MTLGDAAENKPKHMEYGKIWKGSGLLNEWQQPKTTIQSILEEQNQVSPHIFLVQKAVSLGCHNRKENTIITSVSCRL